MMVVYQVWEGVASGGGAVGVAAGKDGGRGICGSIGAWQLERMEGVVYVG